MPNLIDLAQRATDRPPVATLYGQRCLMVRDTGARCTTCADACPVEALVVQMPVEEGAQPYESVNPTGEAGPHIDDEACVRCGACVVACPTNALLALPPLDDETLLGRIAAAGEAAERKVATGAVGIESESARDDGQPPRASRITATAGFACERMAQELRLDGDRAVVLPCLAWIDTPSLVHLACNGAERIVVPLDACATCELTSATERVSHATAEAQRICDLWELGAVIETTSEGALCELEVETDTDAAGELSRRNLFSQARTSLIGTAKAEAAKQLDSLVGAPRQAEAEPEPDTRRWHLLDNLHAVGLPEGRTVVPRTLAPRVSIDVEHCSGCAQCALFCPTGALRKAGRLPGGKTLLEFDPARCRNCGICENTCRYGALTCEETLTAPELFALAPLELTLPKRRVLPERRRESAPSTANS